MALMWAQVVAESLGNGVGLTGVVSPYMGIFFAAFFVSFLLTPVMRMLATRNGIVDWPDLSRKNHIQPVAYLGGVAIFFGWLIGVGMSYVTQPHTMGLPGSELSYVSFPMSIILGAAAITFTGMFDDVYGISPRVKVGGQFFAAAALASESVGLWLAEDSLALIGLAPPEWVIYLLGTALIAIFVVGGCNSLNLLDGLDGLAAGVTAIACIGFMVIAGAVALRAFSGDMTDAGSVNLSWDAVRIAMCIATLGAVLGFLPYNFNPATIFMGDAGSLLLGYLSVSIILLFAQVSGDGPKIVTAALIVFALPITDTSLAIFRRKMRGKPIFSPDNGHIHHLLRRSGLSVKQAVLVLYGAATIFATLGCALVVYELAWRYVMAVFVVLYAFVMVTAFKYGQRQLLMEQLAAGSAGAAAASAETSAVASAAAPVEDGSSPAGPATPAP